jgi:hypothetical protein
MFDESALFIITIVGCSVWGANLVLHNQDCLQENSKAIFQNCSGPARKQFQWKSCESAARQIDSISLNFDVLSK